MRRVISSENSEIENYLLKFCCKTFFQAYSDDNKVAAICSTSTSRGDVFFHFPLKLRYAMFLPRNSQTCWFDSYSFEKIHCSGEIIQLIRRHFFLFFKFFFSYSRCEKNNQLLVFSSHLFDLWPGTLHFFLFFLIFFQLFLFLL